MLEAYERSLVELEGYQEEEPGRDNLLLLFPSLKLLMLKGEPQETRIIRRPGLKSTSTNAWQTVFPSLEVQRTCKIKILQRLTLTQMLDDIVTSSSSRSTSLLGLRLDNYHQGSACHPHDQFQDVVFGRLGSVFFCTTKAISKALYTASLSSYGQRICFSFPPFDASDVDHESMYDHLNSVDGIARCYYDAHEQCKKRSRAGTIGQLQQVYITMSDQAMLGGFLGDVS
jgi:hypothetical protein